MAQTDAVPQPKRAAAYRVYYPLYLTTGALVSTATSIDTEVSKDGGSFTDCTNEWTEVGTTGNGYIDLTASEMTANNVNLKTTFSNTNNMPAVVNIVPTQDGDWGAKLDNAVAHGGALGSSTATLGLSRIYVQSQTSNFPAVTFLGNGTGHGLSAQSGTGATGNGANFVSNATAGDGLAATGKGTGSGASLTSGGGATGNGLTLLSAATNGHGFNSSGVGTGDGIRAVGGGTGHGLEAIGGGSSGNAIKGTTTNGHALNLTSTGTSMSGIAATGSGGGNGILATGQGAGSGVSAVSGATGTGILVSGNSAGISVTASAGTGFSIGATGGDGVQISGDGGVTIVALSGNNAGIDVTGSGTEAGILSTGGASNGFGAEFAGQGAGAGVSMVGGNTGDGLVLQPGVGGTYSLNMNSAVLASGNVTFGSNFTITGTTTHTGNVALSDGLTITRSSSNQPGVSIAGNGTGNGVTISSGSGATGTGLSIAALSTNGSAMSLTGNGTGNGLIATGGASAGGDGIEISGGGGEGLRVNTINCTSTFTVGGTMSLAAVSTSGTVTLNALTVTNNFGVGGNFSVAGTSTLTGAVSATNVSNDIRGVLPSQSAGAITSWNIIDQGTAQSASATTLVLRAAANIENDNIIGARIFITGGTTGVYSSAIITDYVQSTDTATISAWPGATPSGTITYIIFGASASSGTGLTAQETRNAMQLSPTGVTQTNSIDYKLDNLAASTGSGAYTITTTVTDGSSPLQSAIVRLIEGVNVFSGLSDVNGETTWALNAATYAVAVAKDGYQFTPTTRTVTGDHAGTLENDLEMTQVSPNPPPAEPDECVIYGYIRDSQTLEMLAGVVVTATLSTTNAYKAGGVMVGRSSIGTTDTNGYFTITVPKNTAITPSGTSYLIECDDANYQQTTTCNTDTLDIGSLIT